MSSCHSCWLRRCQTANASSTISLDLAGAPPVDLRQVPTGAGAVAGDVRVPHVLALVAGRAQGNHPLEPLDMPLIVVDPHLMALDGVSRPAAAAHLAAVTRPPVHRTPDEIPVVAGEPRAHVRVPAGLGNQLNRQPWALGVSTSEDLPKVRTAGGQLPATAAASHPQPRHTVAARASAASLISTWTASSLSGSRIACSSAA